MMTKTEEKIQVIEEMLSSCVIPEATAFTHGNIPLNKFQKAKNKYAYDAQYEDTIALIDTTIFSSGARGMLITTHDIYIKKTLTAPEHYSLNQLERFTMPGEIYFHQDHLRAMLSKLEKIENRPERAASDELKQMEPDIISYRDAIRDCIKNINDLESDDDVFKHIVLMLSFSCLLANNFDGYKDAMGLEEDEEAYETIKDINFLVDKFDDLLDEYINTEIESLSRTFRRFHSDMLKIMGELKSELKNADIKDVALEDYYNRAQASAKTAQNKLTSLIKFLKFS